MSAPSRAVSDTEILNLDALRQMSFAELDTLYRAAPRPASIATLDGAAIGAMLAWRSPRSGPLASLLRKFGSSTVFPWEGKTFTNQGSEAGRGINRVNLFGKRQWFPFRTRFAASFLDGKPTFLLDYSGPGNPPLIRQIVDEVREVAPGLYMGPAALNVGGRPRPVLFFAVSHAEARS